MIVNKGSGGHSIQGVFVFMLLGLFALMSTLMVLLGAQMYRGTVENTRLSNEERVLAAYVRSMIQSHDEAGAVRAETYTGFLTGDEGDDGDDREWYADDEAFEAEGEPAGSVQALALYEDIDGDSYVTWIYCWQGQLWEQFTDAESDFDPEAGTPVCEAGGMSPEIENGLVTVRMTDGRGEEVTVRSALRSIG